MPFAQGRFGLKSISVIARPYGRAGSWQSQMGCNYPEGILPFGQDDDNIEAAGSRPGMPMIY